MIEAVIFDVDGTLVDSNDFHAQAWQEAFRDFGKTVEFDAIRQQIGKGGDQLKPVFCSPEELDCFGEALEQRRVELFAREYLPRVRPFPQVRELCERIRAEGLRIVLASSAKEQEVEHYKKLLRLEDLLDTATSADDAERSKPYPDIFQAALAGLRKVSPAEAIVVGDTPYDMLAAGGAGMRAIGVLSGGFPADALRRTGAVRIYRNVAELLERFDGSPLARTRSAVTG